MPEVIKKKLTTLVKPMSAPEKHTIAQRNYYQRQRALGLSRKAVWVPEEAASEFWASIDALHAKWRRRGLMP